MPFDAETPMTLMTTASALALWDAAKSADERLAAGEAMAAILRASPKKRPVAAKSGAAATSPAAALLAACKRLSGVIEARAWTPILTHVLIEAAGDAVTLIGTDLDMQWRETIAMPGVGHFKATAPFREFSAALKGAREVAMRFEPIAEGEHRGGRLFLTVDGADVRLTSLHPSDFPVMAPRELYRPPVTFEADTLPAALTFVRPCISTEETRHYLNGVGMHTTTEAGEFQLRFVATDGHRLAVRKMTAPAGLRMESTLILPRLTVEFLVRHASGPVQFEWTGEGARLRFGGGELLSKLIEASYPDYQRLIPREVGDHVVTIEDPRAFVAAVDRLTSQSQERSRSILLSFEHGQRVVGTVRNLDGGEAKGDLPATVRGGTGEIGLNSIYLRNMLALADGPVKLHVNRKSDPIRVEFDAGRVGVIMPLRV